MNIREAFLSDASTIARLIRVSNQDVALTFGLNADNCPNHPSFCTEDWVQADFEGGARYFILEAESEPFGCVSCESPRPSKAYLNRLAVLPEHRRHGFGALLVQHILDIARSEGIQTISIGVIGEHLELRHWYEGLGFTTGESKRFPHLPFTVTYMNCAVPLG